MDKRIVYTANDGSVAIIIPTGNVEAAMKDVPKGVTGRVVDVSQIPQDRTFRNAWTDANPGDTVGVDMEKARGIHMGRIRQVRDTELKRLDIEQLKGKDVAAEKQALRDLPEAFDLTAAQTPEELKALWPAELPG